MLNKNEYEYCRLITCGYDKELACKKAFMYRREQARDAIPSLDSRADIAAMLDFITGDLGKYDDDTTRLVRMRQTAYELANNADIKPNERAAMMTQYAKLTSEIKKQQARDEQANEDVDALLLDLKKAKRPQPESEVIEDGQEEVETDQEGGRQEDVLGASAAEEALSNVC